MIESGILKPSGSVQLKGGTYAELSSSNPLLACRELCVEVDTGKAKVGNGTDYYNSLPYAGGVSSGERDCTQNCVLMEQIACNY